MFIVLQWHYNERDGNSIFPELTAVFGPFQDKAVADKWAESALIWGGWGRYEYQVETLTQPEEPENVPHQS